MALPAPSDDRTAVVTGASSGIGTEIARRLARRGHRVTLVARSGDRLAALADEITAAGGAADVITADLTDRPARVELLDRVEALGVTPEILVNNAGLSTLGPVAEADPESEVAMVELDVVAVVDLCTRFLPGMVERGRGAVLNVASIAAFQPMPGQAAYAAGKAFVLSYTHALVGELRGTGVTATAVCPGPVKTAFGRTAGFTQEQEDNSLPSVMWLSAENVARVAVDGMAKGRSVVVPGVANRISTSLAHMTPRSLLVPLMAKGHPGLP